MNTGFAKFVLFRKGQTAAPLPSPYVAEGVVFSDGKAVVAWFVGGRGVVVYASLDAAIKDCCADGQTELIGAEIPR